jgi:hypothetical protein
VAACTFLHSPVALPALSRAGEICLPERVRAELDGEVQESLLAHELAHLRRRDPLWRLALAAFERIFFLQPLNRIVARQLEAEAEITCDELALRWTAGERESGNGLALARCLQKVAAWSQGEETHMASALIERPSAFVRRVERVLAGPAPTPPRSQLGFLGLGLGVCLGWLGSMGPGIAPMRSVDPVQNSELQDSGLEALRELGYFPQSEQPPAEEETRVPCARLFLPRDGCIQLVTRPSSGSETLGIWSAEENWQQELGVSLQLLSRNLERSPVDPADPSSILLPRDPVYLGADQGRPFRDVQEVMEICGLLDIGLWNLSLQLQRRDGTSVGFATPLPFPSTAELDASMVRLVIQVEEEGERIDARTGEAWSGAGPYEFGERRLSYHLTHWVRPDPQGSLLAKRPQSTLKLVSASLDDLGHALEFACQLSPQARVLIDPKPGTVYQDVVEVLELVEPRFGQVVFTGAHD